MAVTSTGYYYSNARIVSEAAALLGKRADAEKYAALAEEIRAAFLREFYNSADGTLTSGNQTAMACGLYQGLIDPAERGKVLAALVAEVDRCDGHIDCGILGAKYVMNALTDCDRVDVGYRVATQTTFPGWGHWVQMGATTLWENWDGQSSRIHHMFSDIGAWLYKALAGINVDPASPGFKHTIIRPNPVGDLRSVTAEHRSMYGPVRGLLARGSWRLRADVAVPPNTTATVHVPTIRPEDVREGGSPARDAEGVEFLRAQGGRAVYAVESGEYRFEAPWEPVRPEA